MRGEVHILVYCPIDTFQWGSTHSALLHRKIWKPHETRNLVNRDVINIELENRTYVWWTMSTFLRWKDIDMYFQLTVVTLIYKKEKKQIFRESRKVGNLKPK